MDRCALHIAYCSLQCMHLQHLGSLSLHSSLLPFSVLLCISTELLSYALHQALSSGLSCLVATNLQCTYAEETKRFYYQLTYYFVSHNFHLWNSRTIAY